MNGSDYLKEIRKAARCDAVKLHRKEIFAGDFSFAKRELFSKDEWAAVELVRECFQNLDPALVAECRNRPQRIVPLVTALRHACERETHILQVRRSELEKRVSWLPEGRKEKQVWYFIRAYAGEVESGQLLYQYCDGPGMDFSDFAQAVDVGDEKAYDTAIAFLRWSHFKLSAVADGIMNEVFWYRRNRDVIKMRADNISAKETAENFHISTRRIPEIEKNAKRRLYHYFERAENMMPKICADCNGDPVISAQTLETYFGDYTPELVYLLKALSKDEKYKNHTHFAFDEYLDAFVFGNVVPSDFIRSRMNELPDVLSVDAFETNVAGMGEEMDLGLDHVRRILTQFYSPKGRFYVKNGTPSSKLYREVVKRYFPDGIQLYRKGDLDEFRRHMLEDFGIDLSSMKDHSITAALMSFCTPCSPGLYRAP